MSNRKYPRLADGYHDRSQYPPYQTSNKYSSKNHSNCNTDGRERDRSPVGGSSNNRGSSPYGSRHTNSSPRSHRSKSSIRSRESGKRGSSKSPTDVNTNSHGSERHSKPNHVSNDEAFTWTQHVSSSGKVYYYNSKTEKSQWEKPKDWLEREKREKERKEKEKRDLGGSKDGRESAFYREHMAFAKTGKYVSPSKGGQREYYSSIDKRDGNHVESRNSSNDQRKEMQRLSESDRGYVVVKTCSAHTTALPTVVHRSTPIATVFGGETTVSPAGSLQDVSPPTTPSSRPSLYEPSSHTPSPNVATAVSPHVAQLPAAHSPQLHYNQQSPQFPPRHGLPIAQNRFPQVAISVPPGAPSQHHFTPRQYCGPQQAPHPQINNYRQYSHVNSSGPPLPHMVQQVNSAPLPVVAHPVPSQRSVMFNAQVSPQPALHPLQQATLVLQQRKLSEAQAVANVQQPYSPASVHPRPVLSPIPGSLHVKDDRSHHSSPGSPVVFAHSSLKEQMPTQLYPHHNSQQLNAVPAGGSPVGLSGSHAQPSSLPSPVHIQQQATPSVNLQAVAKYVDKNLANHVSGWPTEMLDRQLQKLGDDTTCYSNDSDKAKIEQIQLQSEIGFMELRLETASKRISSLKGLTRTLEALLAESDVKFLS